MFFKHSLMTMKLRYGYTPAEATLLKTFNTDIAAIRKNGLPFLKQMSESAFAVLTNSTELSKQLLVQSVAGEKRCNN